MLKSEHLFGQNRVHKQTTLIHNIEKTIQSSLCAESKIWVSIDETL